MLQYLVIQLDDTSVSYCHYENRHNVKKLISLDDLRKGILFAMKENLTIQFLYPSYILPKEYKEVIGTIDHCDIVPARCEDADLRAKASILIVDDWTDVTSIDFMKDVVVVIRTSKRDLFDHSKAIEETFRKVQRLNIVVTNVETFREDDFETYKNMLDDLSRVIEHLYVDGKSPQLNLLTDRLMLDKMNNCNAGYENITLAPDGRFYVCPAFYLENPDEDFGLGKSKFDIGDLKNGVHIKNAHLYKLDYAPLCRKCDAYQCKRCVWLNRKTTYEINTPSHEQCVIAHLERNASRKILYNIRKFGVFQPNMEIRELSYLDPFEENLKI